MTTISAFISVLNNIWPYAVAVLVFIVLIIIHEFGHFIAAKLMGVRVNEFAVGFGPKLFAKTIGETTYKVNLIPLGGYCAMEGEEDESSDEKAFCQKKPWRRFIIVVAGALFNIILGIILVAVSLIPGEYFATTKVAKFTDSAMSVQSGLMAGDEIIEVDSRKIFTTYDLSYAFTGISDGTVDMCVLRDGQKVELQDVKFATQSVDGIDYISVDFWVEPEEKNFFSFIKQTLKMTLSYARVVWFSLIDLIGGKFGINAISGPVGVTAAIGTAAKQSLANIWPIMALITINLGIFNLLPLPALDGGRLLFILIEMIFRKPVPQKFENLVHTLGFVLLFGLMILITFKDILKLITG